jgi:hypothetical protein
MQWLIVRDVIGGTVDPRVYRGGELRAVKIHPIEAHQGVIATTEL